MRAEASWLRTGLLLLVIAGLGSLLVPEPTGATGAAAHGGIASVGRALHIGDPHADLEEVLRLGLVALGWLLALSVAAVVVGRALTGGLGPVHRGVAPTGSRSSPRAGPAVAVLLVALVGAVLAVRLQPALAGAVRGVDASASGLAVLWSHWLVVGVATIGVALTVAGLFELAASRRARVAALWMTRQEARDEARRGARRRA